jgi:hypothetical protein
VEVAVPQGQSLSHAPEQSYHQALRPWHSHTATTHSKDHDDAFLQWHNDLISATQRPKDSMQVLLNRHTHNIWFGMNHDFTFVRPLGVAPSIFHTPPFPFYLDEEIMDKEVTAWPGVTKE